MKGKIMAFLNDPRRAITRSAILALILTPIIYTQVAVPPRVSDTDMKAASQDANVGGRVDLAFTKPGRLESVRVAEGAKVKRGEVLAVLSAPDALGLVKQAKSALDLAEAQYALLNVDYANTKKQQDLIVQNAYAQLLKTGPAALPRNTLADHITVNYPAPIISGNYALGKEGSMTIQTYAASEGLALKVTGLVATSFVITPNAMPIGDSGLFVSFTSRTPEQLAPGLTWTIKIPNTDSPQYAANKSVYDLAVATREKTLASMASTLGANGAEGVAQAQVAAARGAYEAALGAYQGYEIVAPIDGTVTSVDSALKTGQAIGANRTVISITAL